MTHRYLLNKVRSIFNPSGGATHRLFSPKPQPHFHRGPAIHPDRPATVRECATGWHIHNGRGDKCFTFAKWFDGCRLEGDTAILTKRRGARSEVSKFVWDETKAAFVPVEEPKDIPPPDGPRNVTT